MTTLFLLGSFPNLYWLFQNSSTDISLNTPDNSPVKRQLSVILVPVRIRPLRLSCWGSSCRGRKEWRAGRDRRNLAGTATQKFHESVLSISAFVAVQSDKTQRWSRTVKENDKEAKDTAVVSKTIRTGLWIISWPTVGSGGEGGSVLGVSVKLMCGALYSLYATV